DNYKTEVTTKAFNISWTRKMPAPPTNSIEIEKTLTTFRRGVRRFFIRKQKKILRPAGVKWFAMHMQEDTTKEILAGIRPSRTNPKRVAFEYPRSFTPRKDVNPILGAWH
ncbi:hypothetical protein CYMTET_21004, partial [Cymbomonas tetramitiformis]